MSVTVLVPVYQALDDLEQCLAALDRTLPDGARVLLADDASPDAAIPALLERFVAQTRLRVRVVRREAHLGFVGNVNRGFAECAPDDVILLNSDTVPAPGWYEAMRACAASDARIGTITPWSNNAEICSFPELCRAAPVPSEADAARIARATMSAGAGECPELPTGVGFCMFVRRAMLDAIGDFDQATFGRGYGEENDLCLRGAGHGWRNVLCAAAYVAHRGGASFGPTGHHAGGENLARLVARYPHYNAQVAEFILRDPLAPLRERIAASLDAAAQPPANGEDGHQGELFPSP